MRAAWIAIFMAVLVWSGIAPKDFLTWVLEVFPAVAGGIVLWLTREKFPLTTMLYVLILLHCIVLMVGGHYTYAQVPLFDWLGTERNNYDKLGHFMQGFVPALVAREILIRHHVVSTRAWLNSIVIAFCLAVSALYELVEWLVAVLAGASSEAFLATQGYEWDTQTDMAMALLGACCALVMLSGVHDRQLRAQA